MAISESHGALPASDGKGKLRIPVQLCFDGHFALACRHEMHCAGAEVCDISFSVDSTYAEIKTFFRERFGKDISFTYLFPVPGTGSDNVLDAGHPVRVRDDDDLREMFIEYQKAVNMTPSHVRMGRLVVYVERAVRLNQQPEEQDGKLVGDDELRSHAKSFSSLMTQPMRLPHPTALAPATPDRPVLRRHGSNVRRPALGSGCRGGGCEAMLTEGAPLSLLSEPRASQMDPELIFKTVALHGSLRDVPTVEASDITILAKLGEGQFGEVALAQVQQYGTVAIKWLKDEYRSGCNPDLIHEAATMWGMSHPNIVNMLGLVVDSTVGGRSCGSGGSAPIGIVSEYVPNGSLTDYLHSHRGQITLRQRTNIALQIARAMAHLHTQSAPLVHFDLKPDNVLLAWDGDNMVVKVTDFGLSSRKYGQYITCRARGTLPYMAYEVMPRKRFGDVHVTEKADVYSFGVLLWELFTGRLPFDGMEQDQFIRDLRQGYVHLHIPRDCEPEWRELIAACRQLDPEKRPSFPKLVSQLQEMLQKEQHRAVASRPVKPWSPGLEAEANLAWPAPPHEDHNQLLHHHHHHHRRRHHRHYHHEHQQQQPQRQLQVQVPFPHAGRELLTLLQASGKKQRQPAVPPVQQPAVTPVQHQQAQRRQWPPPPPPIPYKLLALIQHKKQQQVALPPQPQPLKQQVPHQDLLHPQSQLPKRSPVTAQLQQQPDVPPGLILRPPTPRKMPPGQVFPVHLNLRALFQRAPLQPDHLPALPLQPLQPPQQQQLQQGLQLELLPPGLTQRPSTPAQVPLAQIFPMRLDTRVLFQQAPKYDGLYGMLLNGAGLPAAG